MSILALAIVSIALSTQTAPKIIHFMPISTIVRVAEMAARDEGYNLDAEDIFLDIMQGKDRKEPIPGYKSIGLYRDGHLVRFYAIRVDTGDIVDPMVCEIFRYPNLLEFKRKTIRNFSTKEVSLEMIMDEIGCDKMQIIPSEASPKSLGR